MKGKLNPLKQLDAVLEFLNTIGTVFEHIKIIPNNIFELEDDGINSPTFESIRDCLKEKITETDLRKILKKLHDDTYITINNEQYSITWEGRLFILLDGGYEIKRAEEQKLQTELIQLRRQGAKNENRIFLLTLIIALCGAVASLFLCTSFCYGFKLFI